MAIDNVVDCVTVENLKTLAFTGSALSQHIVYLIDRCIGSLVSRLNPRFSMFLALAFQRATLKAGIKPAWGLCYCC